MATKAQRDGVYEMVGPDGRTHRFRVKAGDLMPEGAKMAPDAPPKAAPKPDAAPKAPKAAKGGTGPAETTAGEGAPETPESEPGAGETS